MDHLLPPTIPTEAERHSAGQRRFFLIWEVTQSVIALGVTLATVYVTSTGHVTSELSNAFFLIIGFYFGRTNHSRSVA